jgi:hypothetical protein
MLLRPVRSVVWFEFGHVGYLWNSEIAQAHPADARSRRKFVFGVSAFPHAEKKITALTSDPATNPECVTQIRMMTLVERAG